MVVYLLANSEYGTGLQMERFANHPGHLRQGSSEHCNAYIVDYCQM